MLSGRWLAARCRMKNPRDSRCSHMAFLCIAGSTLLFCAALNVVAQQPAQSAPASSSAQESSGEMAVKDEATTTNVSDAAQMRVNVRLVLVRVVARDGSGHAIGTLRKEDFELFDNGKRQVISNFDVEHVSANASVPVVP